MDYLGSDYDYNNGGTKVVYDGANVLPTLYITKTKGSGFNLKPNKNNNGYNNGKPSMKSCVGLIHIKSVHILRF